MIRFEIILPACAFILLIVAVFLSIKEHRKRTAAKLYEKLIILCAKINRVDKSNLYNRKHIYMYIKQPLVMLERIDYKLNLKQVRFRSFSPIRAVFSEKYDDNILLDMMEELEGLPKKGRALLEETINLISELVRHKSITKYYLCKFKVMIELKFLKLLHRILLAIKSNNIEEVEEIEGVLEDRKRIPLGKVCAAEM